MMSKYLSVEPALTIAAPTPLVPPVQFNVDKERFKLLKEPDHSELAHAVDDFVRVRVAHLWKEMCAVHGRGCRAFSLNGKRLTYLDDGVTRAILGEATVVDLRNRRVPIDRQNELLRQLEPRTVAEAETLLTFPWSTSDPIGRKYLVRLLEQANTGVSFFVALLDDLFQEQATFNPALGAPEVGHHQPRIYGFLGHCLCLGWLLFPFAHAKSPSRTHKVLLHAVNARNYFDAPHGPGVVAAALTSALVEMKVAKTTEARRSLHMRCLMAASTYRQLEQSSTELFQTVHGLVFATGGKPAKAEAGMQRETFNAVLRLHNSRFKGAPPQRLLVPPKRAVNIEDFASFDTLRQADPRMATWAGWFERFVSSTADSQGQTRKTACTVFGDFLLSLPNPPSGPTEIARAHINDYTDGSTACFRGYLAKNVESIEGRNQRLQMVGAFFAFVNDRLVIEQRIAPGDVTWVAAPVDLKLDRFHAPLKSGTTRTAIGAHIVATMRRILVGDDYAWPKQQGGWCHLANEDTKEIEYVWCPSAAILLFTLLTLPLRSVQGRLLDSGEGDATIYDFDQKKMVPNRNQLPVDGRLDPRRSEGVLQFRPSGMPDGEDVDGIWVTVEKTAEGGRFIPWVSDELRAQLRYQREWIQRYAPHPSMHGIIDAQGHRNLPEEWAEREDKFYCLFRDPSVRNLDPSLPVSKQKLLKLWAALCAETERRLNENGKSTGQSIRLTRVSPAGHVTAIPDIHTLRVSGITDLLDRGVPLNIVSECIAGHATYVMTLWYDKPTPGQVRRALKEAEARKGQSYAGIPRMSPREFDEMRPYLVCNPQFEGKYTGFDAAVDNRGLLLFRHSGICPGTRCEEGALDDKGRIAPVPVGDRGPSCPQCRFWLTGPAFLLGQCIEGNQLILKIRAKVHSLAALRGGLLEAEDADDMERAESLRGQADVEERQLNDMLSEWWHRMRLYEASIRKLDEYRAAVADGSYSGAGRLMLVAHAPDEQLHFGFREATELELKHFLSTCAEFVPEQALEAQSVALDLEMAVGKFLALNDKAELTHLYFKLDDEQRLHAANLAVELMLGAAEDPGKATDLLEGRTPLAQHPELQRALSQLLAAPTVTRMPARKRERLTIEARK